MASREKYSCSCCGQVHDGWPALAHPYPAYYQMLSEAERKDMAMLTPDRCVIQHPGQTDYFIRCTLELKVVDFSDTLEYGVWVSLSEKSFTDYIDDSHPQDYTASCFGRFSTALPDYPHTLGIPVDVRTRPDNLRPEIVPHQNYDHPLVRDYYEGICRAEAERRIHAVLDHSRREYPEDERN